MNRQYLFLPVVLTSALSLCGCAQSTASVSFADDVQPILTQRCGSCHVPGQAGYEASGLSFQSYASLMKGTKFGAVVIPGDALSSALTMLVEGRADPSIRMPHGETPLPKGEQKILHDWVQQGAQDN